MTACIELNDLFVDFPLLQSEHRSFERLLSASLKTTRSEAIVDVGWCFMLSSVST